MSNARPKTALKDVTDGPLWPADRVARRSVDQLVPCARNARTHSDAQIGQIAASIRQWGWTNAVLVDETGAIIAGHGRILAAKQLGLSEVPVMVARGWTDAQKRAYVLADNKLAQNAGWDEELLAAELADLKLEGFDLDLTGFGELEIAGLGAPEVDPAEEWQGMPEFEQDSQHSFRSVMVHFPDQAAVEQFRQAIGQEFSPKAKYIWYPQPVADAVFKDKRYVAERPEVSDQEAVAGSETCQARMKSSSPS